jgi:acetyl-CoA C-acetyltransferase
VSLDPRTPVVVGVGQVINRPERAPGAGEPPEPVDLMVGALRAAAEDAAGVAPGAPAAAGARLLAEAASLRVVGQLGGRLVNPGLVVAERLGMSPRETVVTATGGNMPISLLHDGARSIASGHVDVVAVTGAECLHTSVAARRRGERLHLRTRQDPATTEPPTPFGTERAPATDLEMERGILLPIYAYPLMENARRAESGWSLDEHRARIGALWSRFSQVAASNPYAWLPTSLPAEAIVEPGPANRMVSFPYTKLCTANLQVDQGAAYLCCSVAAARAAGVPEDRWVFPLAGADGADHWFLSERPDLGRSPALRLAGHAALDLARLGVDQMGPVDLYSCFPCAVRIAAHELGLPEDDPARPLTTTGGLTFAGGPGNNYTSHALATVTGLLRAEPGSVGLVTGLGWYSTKHSVALLGSRPPDDEGRGGYRWADVQDEVDTLARCAVDPDATGTVTVETYTVTYDRDGSSELGIVACRTNDGHRAWANVRDPDQLAALSTRDPIGQKGTLAPGGVLSLG